ncbi:hypothetical protein PCASD_02912 [Puccinia coronata f. sp. avenae]|uniref:RRM domain-containing protein n=1 Tax=Puccinia coronata f. sp. avenae TaxID=200324 RepID=A0A2N5VED9_9BASI|nr:hypothetical protein PCASD_02912 [Puccinia coronata f. sp. avenae]
MEQQQFRLHVGGLGPSVAPQDLERRFASFGTVVKVDGVGKLDANGSPLRYAFVDILSTDSEMKRCMNLLSGTTYKGSTLRIAPARPDYVARAERERANLPITTFVDPDEEAIRIREEKAARKLERKLSKFRARKRGIEGYESSNMELMTVKKFKSRQGVNGWKKDPETSLPIFPIVTRPLRPLHPVDSGPSEGNDPLETSDCVRVPTRARRIRIDPTIYRAAIKNRKTHILGPRAMSIQQYNLGFGGGAKDVKKSQATQVMWECELGEDDHVVWRLATGSDVVQEERVQLSSCTLQKLKTVDERHSSKSLEYQSTEHPTTLRLRGGGPSKRPRQSHKQPKPPTPTSLSPESQPVHSPSNPEDPSSDEALSNILKKERLRYLALASQTVAQPLNRADALEEVGQGTQAAVERQKVKEQRQGCHFEDTIEFAPTTVIESSKKRQTSTDKAKSCQQSQQTLQGKSDLDSPLDQSTPAGSDDNMMSSTSEASASSRPKVSDSDNSSESNASSRSESGSDSDTSPESNENASPEPDDNASPESDDDASPESDDSSESGGTCQSEPSMNEHLPSETPHLKTSLSRSPNSDSMSIKESKNVTIEQDVVLPSPDSNARADVCNGANNNIKRTRSTDQTIDDHAKPANTSAVRLTDLTDMFKAKEPEKTGFRLTDVLGEMELDEDVLGLDIGSEMDTPEFGSALQSEQRENGQLDKSKAFIHPYRLKDNSFAQSQKCTQVKPGKRIRPFFFYPTDEDPDDKVINSLISTEHREAVRQQWLSGDLASSSDSWRTFIRTESRTEIETAHDGKKSALTEQMRRKHKDAIKRDRKWGNRQSVKTSTHKGSEAESDLSN